MIFRASVYVAALIHTLRCCALGTVDGLVTVDSNGTGTLTTISDYDVLVVLAEMPVPLHLGITRTCKRFVFFMST